MSHEAGGTPAVRKIMIAPLEWRAPSNEAVHPLKRNSL
jgi:hypothetical protein